MVQSVPVSELVQPCDVGVVEGPAIAHLPQTRAYLAPKLSPGTWTVSAVESSVNREENCQRKSILLSEGRNDGISIEQCSHISYLKCRKVWQQPNPVWSSRSGEQ